MTTKLKPPPPKTGLARYWWLMVIAGWIVVVGGAGLYLYSHLFINHGRGEKPLVELEERVPRGGLGEVRYDILLAATQDYVAANPDAAEDVREGRAFAPADWLNAELKERGEGWRVRDVEGLHATIYEVS